MMTIRLVDWSAGLNKIRLTKLIRSSAGVPLNEAHDAVNRLLAGEAVDLSFPSPQAAQHFLTEVRTLGVRAECVATPESRSAVR